MLQRTLNPGTNDDQENRSWKEHLTKWTVYATASGAALAMSTNASASIVYNSTTTSDQLIHASNVNTVTVAEVEIGGLTMDLSVMNAIAPHRSAVAKLLSEGGGLLFAASNNVAKLYHLGSPIKLTGANTADPILRKQSGQPAVAAGAWGPGTVTGFVGFKTPGGDLGWVELKVLDRNSDGYPDEVDELGTAYNASGGPINAGQTSSSSTPEPNTAALGILAAGAAGLMALRRRRAEVRKALPAA